MEMRDNDFSVVEFKEGVAIGKVRFAVAELANSVWI
jgi:hypothetical protein